MGTEKKTGYNREKTGRGRKRWIKKQGSEKDLERKRARQTETKRGKRVRQ